MNHLVEHFLQQDKQSNKLYVKYKVDKDLKALEKLNEKFGKYLFEINFCSYINKSMVLYSQRYRKRQCIQQNQEILNLNIIDQDFKEEKINLIKDNTTDFIECISQPTRRKVDFRNIIEDKRLLKAINVLPERQMEILYRLIVLEQSEKEVMRALCISQQAINKSKNKALCRLKQEMEVTQWTDFIM